MRKHSTLCWKEIPTDDPDCLEEVKLAKEIKCVIGSKATVGDAEEEFNLEDVESGESGANPSPSNGANPSPSLRLAVAATKSATSAAPTAVSKKKTVQDCP